MYSNLQLYIHKQLGESVVIYPFELSLKNVRTNYSVIISHLMALMVHSVHDLGYHQVLKHMSSLNICFPFLVVQSS